MLRNLLLSLFTSFTISHFIYSYSPLDSILYLFLGTVLVVGFMQFKFEDSYTSKLILKAATALQLTYILLYTLFETGVFNAPAWLLYRDEVVISIVLICIILLPRLINNKDVRNVLSTGCIATAMGFSVVLFVFLNFSFYYILFAFPVAAAWSYIIVAGKEDNRFRVLVTNSLATYALAYFTSQFSSELGRLSLFTFFDLILPATWIATLMIAFIFRGAKGRGVIERIMAFNFWIAGTNAKEKKKVQNELAELNQGIANFSSMGNDELFEVINPLRTTSKNKPRNLIVSGYKMERIEGKIKKFLLTLIGYLLYALICVSVYIKVIKTDESSFAESFLVLFIVGLACLFLIPMFVGNIVTNSIMSRVNGEIDELNQLNIEKKRSIGQIKQTLRERGFSKKTIEEIEEEASYRAWEYSYNSRDRCSSEDTSEDTFEDTYYDRKENYGDNDNDEDNPYSWDNQMKKIQREYSESQAEWARRNDQPRHIVEQYDNEAGRDFYDKSDEDRRLKYDSDIPPSY
ncbi:hypothetical protein [Sporosarcina sp. BP05]|uniref:hypothetical protein n=1 Tax=Sporosarcina sp. BP05 TaxID=2758726 RepID=UPI0016468DC9|nr:hypothetical protein [Sporosarcina sp. BP05]